MNPTRVHALFQLLLLLGCLVISSCGPDADVGRPPAKPDELAGAWILESRLSDGLTVPARERQMKLVLTDEGTFKASFRWDDSQEWTTAGEGAFAYIPPHLEFHWDSGPTTVFLVVEKSPDRLRLHQGRSLAPMRDDEPDQIFVKQGAASEKPAPASS
jgi:hypothetical protein